MEDKLVVNDLMQQAEPSTLGGRLAVAREAKQLTQQDVSNTLRLSLKQVADLENSDFSALPEPMVTRGFIRNYARLLDLDAEPLLAIYRAQVPDRLPDAILVQSSMHFEMPTKGNHLWFKYVLASVVLLVFVLLWFAYMPKSEKPAVEKLNATEHQVVEQSLPEIALPAAERLAGSGTEVLTLPNADVASTVSNSATPVAVLAEPKSVLKLEAPAKVEAKGSEPAILTKKVTVTCTESSWMQAKDKSGKVVFEKKLAAGSTETFDGEVPLSIWIGNAKGTRLTFLGKPVDLTASTQNNVARLTLE
jgi:cytoskeleton protein RodZ